MMKINYNNIIQPHTTLRIHCNVYKLHTLEKMESLPILHKPNLINL